MVAFAPKRKIHGRYIGINYENSRNWLSGCHNDAYDWAAAHKPYVSSSEILLEDKATKAGIFRFVKEALALLQPHDWLILQISGHGSSRPDPKGIEPDGRNEFFLPYDSDKNVIFDDEWYELLRLRVDLSRVLFITDCCYSGSLARGIERQRTRPRFVPFDKVAMSMPERYREELCSCAVHAARSEADGIAEGVVHLSGCRDDEVSYDARFNGRANGAMSYYALQSLRELKPGATFLDWKRAIGKRLPSKQFKQSPQMNASDNFWDTPLPGFELAGQAAAPLAGPNFPPMVLQCGEYRSKPIEWERN